MFLLQVTNTLKNPICRYQLYWKCFRNTQLHSKIFYCTDNNNTNRHKHITDSTTRLTHNVSDKRKGFYNQNKVHHRNDQLKTHNTSQHETPLLHLNSIYNIVNHEFGKSYLSFDFAEDKKSYPHKHTCTVNISWPNEMSFSETALSKKAATLHAAKKCLTWLIQTNNVKGSLPKLYTSNEIRSMLSQDVKIDLDSKFHSEIEYMLDKYYHRIEPILKESPITNISQIESANTQTSFKNFSGNDQIRNRKLFNELMERSGLEKDLPIQQYKLEILNSILNNQITIIKGETGCGKSTQIPQYIMDYYTENLKAHECNILVSQPRRVSAVSLAQRVAVERGERLGHVVGYHIRLENEIPHSNGSILFCTTGIILRKLQKNATLENVSHVIIDEAHERTLEIDVLLALLKKLLNIKPNLKLIIMSATVNSDLLKNYFSCDIIEIPGKIFPVKTHFLEDMEPFKQRNNTNLRESETPLNDMTKLVQWIIQNKPPGGILCFLPGWNEIQQLSKMLENLQYYKIHIIPFHSKLSNDEQQEVFKPVPENFRKIILATDIAENSITIPDIKYVVDAVRKRNLIWDEEKSMYNISTLWVTRANISQRKGRAGRVSPGESYHLITKDKYNQLQLFPEPEIRRLSLNQLIVTSKTFSNDKVRDFFKTMIEQPMEKSISSAIDSLTKLNILDEDENLTPLGKRMKYFTMDVRLSKALILSCVFQCLSPILSLVTMFSTASDINATSLTPKSVRKDMKNTFHDTSDHIAIIRHFRSHILNKKELMQFDEGAKDSTKYLSLFNLYIHDLINHNILHSVEDCERFNTFSKHSELIRAIVFSASNQVLKVLPFGYKRGYITKTLNTIVSEDKTKVIISPDSVNSKRETWPSPFLTYFFRVGQHGRISTVSDTSIISPLVVLLFSQCEVISNKVDEQNVLITLTDLNVHLRCDERTANSLLEFRHILWEVINYVIQHQGEQNHKDVVVVNSYKEEMLGLLMQMISESENSIDNSVVVDKSQQQESLD